MVNLLLVRLIKSMLIVMFLTLTQFVVFPLASHGGYHAEEETTPKWGVAESYIYDYEITQGISAQEFWGYVRDIYHVTQMFIIFFGFYLLMCVWVEPTEKYRWLKW